ncbi:MAG: diguanylate cyclase, partial [Epsilonproteobacteria bacterium]|nr:diguanylate cyclase [Campylobacterota bacterium]
GIKILTNLFKSLELNVIDMINMVALKKNPLKYRNNDIQKGLCNYDKVCKILSENSKMRKKLGRNFAVIVVKINDIKDIKKTFGKKLSDRIFVETATIIKNNSRIVDMVGKWKDDEIVVILPWLSKKNAFTIAKNFEKTVQNHKYKKIGKLISISTEVIGCNEKDRFDDIVKKIDDASRQDSKRQN